MADSSQRASEEKRSEEKRTHNVKLGLLLLAGLMGLGMVAAVVGGILGTRAGAGAQHTDARVLAGTWQAVTSTVGDECHPVNGDGIEVEFYEDRSGWAELQQGERALGFTWEYEYRQSGKDVFAIRFKGGNRSRMIYDPQTGVLTVVTGSRSTVEFRKK